MTIPGTSSSPLPGQPFPLGATVRDAGTNFAVVADGHLDATRRDPAVELCLIDGDAGQLRERRIPLREQTSGIWHVFVPGVGAGQRYGYRVHAHDGAALLVDPYAREVTTTGYDLDAAATAHTDTLGLTPLGLVTEPVRARAARPEVPWEHTVIYEAHVKGLTQQHPDIPTRLRGSFAAVAHPAMIDHLRRLHVTAVELLPVHAHTPEPLLKAAGRPNYWGYSTLSFFALHPDYATVPGGERAEFVEMVDGLHEAGIEVILDVVYNHTCEGGPDRPLTLSWRGLSPATYYLDGTDLTGTGNTLNTGPLPVVRMVTDSLRYFATDLGVDGFRFDLAPVLGRPDGGDFDAAAALLTAIEADPVLRERKLIAEPWDATGNGYSLGRFRSTWAEWNDRFRGTVRDFWRGTPGVRDLAYRLSGSEDVFGSRRPWASVNMVTAHDGFTLRDLVSYERKHNDANGQHGHDGTDDNRSANYGYEGDAPDLDPAVTAVRLRQARNIAAALLLATGTPMLTAGDEMWRTQDGNNNAYCLDSAQVWLDWAALRTQQPADLLTFFQRLTDLRASAPALHQGEFFSGRPPVFGDDVADLKWFSPSGNPMTDADWFDPELQTLGMWFDGNDVRGHGRHGEPLCSDSYLVMLHAGGDDIQVILPGPPYGTSYLPLLDTATATGQPRHPAALPAATPLILPGRSVWLLRADRHDAPLPP